MRILITGATGLLGSNVVERLAAQQSEVFALVREKDDLRTTAATNVIPIDFETNWKIAKLPKTIDSVVHLSQSANFRNFPDSALSVFQVNVASTARLLDYAGKAGARSFVFASSGGIYGTGEQPFSETSPPLDPTKLGYYLGSKLASEALLHSYQSKFSTVALRFFYIYGPHQTRSMLIPRLMDNVLNGREITLQGEHGMHINPIHVSDAAKAVIKAIIPTGDRVYNIAGPNVLSIRQIAETMGRHLGASPLFKTVPEKASDMVGDITLMRDRLNDPQIRLTDSFADILR